MGVGLRQKDTQKGKLSSTMRGWLPILQASLEDLPEALEPFKDANPFLEIKTPREKNFSFFSENKKNSITKAIEWKTEYEKSLYEFLQDQINPPLFPTQKSQQIAYSIIESINEEGYFDADIEQLALKNGWQIQEVEKIRQRFAYLEPVGVGAKDVKESFLFQLDEFDLEVELYDFVKELIENLENISSFSKNHLFSQAFNILKKFKNPPAIEFFQNSKEAVPDIFVFQEEGRIEIKLNDSYYPLIEMDTEGLDEQDEYVKEKIKNAKDLVDALEMRKATIYKIGLMIVEYQYDFFTGGAIKPMRLKDIAFDLERNPSTVSRAIANKFLACNRGVYPLKSFFTAAIDEDTSNSSIKDFMLKIIKNENKKKPLSDNEILELVEKHFNVKMVRRTITKYRQQFNIASSSERKKLYEINCAGV